MDETRFPADTLYLKMAADKGGGVTKISIALLNRPISKTESPFNPILLAVYDGDDDGFSLRKYVKVYNQTFGIVKSQVFKDVFTKFESINEIEIGGRMWKVNRYFVGDLKTTAAVKGLKVKKPIK